MSRLTFPSLIIVLSFCAAAAVAGESTSPQTLTNIKQRADAAKIATSREWLLINHYKKRNVFSGYKSEIDGKDYFLSAKGKIDPSAELHATIDSFAQPEIKGTNDKHPQCRYIGRRNFLFEKLSVTEIPKLECPAHAEWKKRLDVVGASVIFASAYFGNPASMFGHTFIKLHTRNNNADRDLLNYGVSFAADTGSDGGAGYAYKGLVGGYPSNFSLLPYHDKLREYTGLEGRDVFEYSLNLTQPELDRMLDHLLEIQNTHFDYYFLDENCSYQLLSLLEIARPTISLTDKFVYFVIPADTVRWMMTSNGLVSDIKFRPSLITELISSTEAMSPNERELTRELASSESQPIKLANLSINDQAKVYDGALRYVSLLAYDEPAQWKEKAFQLQTKRAALGVVSPTSHSTAPPRPEQGHDSSQLGLGFGQRDDNQFVEYHGRAAYHHLLSNETGYLENSHLEIVRLSARSYFDPGETLFQEVSLVDIIALSPWSAYFKPISWRANFGISRLADQPFDSALAFTANGGVGNTLSFGQSQNVLWFSFLQLHSDTGPDLDRNSRTGASVQSQLLIKPLRRLSVTAGAEYRHYFLGGDYQFTRAWGEAGISFTRNLELRGGYTRSDQVDEGKALLIHHLLF